MPKRVVAEGPRLVIEQWANSRAELEDDFFNCPGVTEADKKKLVKTFRLYCATGLPHNKEKFRRVEDKIYEIKATSQLRLLGFIEGQRFIIILCLRKKKDRLNRQDIEKAIDLMRQYYEQPDR